MEAILYLFSAFLYSVFFTNTIATQDTITPTLPLYDGQTLVSSDSSFELGFFSPGDTQQRYLGIWYNKISIGTIVWVANREAPLTGNSGVLKISNSGNLVILNNRTNSIIWSNSYSSTQTQNQNNPLVAQLLNSGNLVLKHKNNIGGDDPNNYIWQSFDYPCHLMLPGMKLGWNFKTGLHRFLSSWRTTTDPSPGDYTYGIDLKGFPQLELKKGETVTYRAGSWNGIRFSGTPHLSPNLIFQFDFVYNREEVYYTYVCPDSSKAVVSELVLNPSGWVHRDTWNDRSHEWVVYKSVPSDRCDNYGSCGAYGSCDIDNSPVCQCLDRFVPKSPEDWDLSNWADGCVRRTEIGCGKGEGFRLYSSVKLPDTANSVVNLSISVAECEKECLKNCSCTAYAMADIKEGNGCLVWIGELMDIRALPDKGQDLYIKMAASELDKGKGDINKKRRLILLFTCVPLLFGMLLLGLFMYIRKGKCNLDKNSKDNMELPLLDFVTITAATNNFSYDNKLGQGGFGPVYKGMLPDGQEIAVKRLSRNSDQGLNEFKNEVLLISKLQHRNLVKLLGCCIQGEEKMLIYEYLPNRSLDSFIFHQTKSATLDWGKRYDIICGIARGLLYLHQDSRLRIVHRDLKASNILLDDEMNPKISDFGLARPFGGDQSEENTGKVVGTYGYMSPEYATHGFSSVKSDVFSFGVIVLEIVSGKKNRGFYHPEHNHYLLGHAWSLWKEDEPLKLVDATIGNSFNQSEVLRCIHVGLLCVQQSADERPSMPSVVLMLGSEAANLPQPNHPGFFSKMTDQGESSSSSRKREQCNSTEVSITMLEGR